MADSQIEMRNRFGPDRRPPGLIVLLTLMACGSEPETPADPPPEAAGEPEEIAVVPAEYATDIAFVGFAAEPLRLYARFVNETSENTLERRYGGWLESDGDWRSLAELNDRLPVPRAAWRVLPGGAWRVLADDGGEIGGLVYRDTLTEIRLTPGQLVAEWTGETGQREALLLARAQRGDSVQDGLLVLRRSARVKRDEEIDAAAARTDGSAETPGVGIQTQLFLLVDSLSNGLLVARDASDPDSTAVAWTWVGSIGNEWTDVRIQPPPENASRANDRWRVELPEAGVTALFRLERLPGEPRPEEPPGRQPRPFGISGRLEILGSGRPASGLGVESRS